MVSDTSSVQKQPKTKRRKLNRHDVEAIARLVVKYRLNETEAALEHGISPKSWFCFKNRHKTQEKYEAMINAVRGSQLRNCIDSIDKSGSDREFEQVTKSGETVTVTKPGDWRAKAWIAERVLAPERLADRQQTQQVNVSLFNMEEVAAKLAKVYGQAQVSVAPEQKQIDVVSEVKPV